MDYKKLELKLRKIVEKRLREGVCVRPGLGWRFSTGRGECCAVGAIDPYTSDWSGFYDCKRLADRIGLDVASVLAISDGFENNDFDRSSGAQELRAIGARIRRDYCEFSE